MEHHTSASMYIPSSKVLARLQRHAAAMGQGATSAISASATSSAAAPVAVPPASSNNSSSAFAAHRETGSRDTLAALSASPAKSDAAAVLAEASATVSKPSGAAGSTPSALGASSSYPRSPAPHTSLMGASTASKSTCSGAASVAHSAVSNAAAPPSMFTSRATSSVFPPETPVGHTSGIRTASEALAPVEGSVTVSQVSSVPLVTPSSIALPPRASTWLLPVEDFTYILSSLTWNVDLLRLLLPLAPCPLHLPDAEPLAEASSSAVGEAAAATPPCAISASPTQGRIAGNEEEMSAESQREWSTVMRCPDTSSTDSAAAVAGASSTGTLESVATDTHGDAAIAGWTIHASAHDDKRQSYSPATATGSSPGPCALLPSPASSSVLTTSASVAGASAAVSPAPLTWSQYLFRGAGGGDARRVIGSPGDGAARVMGDTALGGPQQQRSTLARGLPHSHSDGALVCAPKAAAGTAAPNSASASSSIFDTQYLPSLKEFQLQVEARKQRRQQLLLRQQQQPQQQQQPPALSATRLQEHLQQQPQTSPSHHRRRTAANKLFLYSPTPSVMSLATTSASTAAGADAPGKDEESPPPPPERCNNTAHVPCLYPSSAPPSPWVSSSASQAHQRPPQSKRLPGRCGTRLRPCTVSASSLDHLGCGGRDDEEGAHEARAAEAPSRMPHSAPYPSRPSSQPPHLSRMMMQAADQLRATLVPSSARAPSPLLLHWRNGRTSHNSRESSRATARDDAEGDGVEENEGDEEWVSNRGGVSGSGNAWPSSSSPASPTASISSMSLGRVWSSTVSGSATPGNTLVTGISGSVANYSSHFNAKSSSGVGHASPHSAARGRKKARRRRAATCTRGLGTMRIYVPSITEGPKAASLYTAPTAEAQELLLLLLHRATAPLPSGAAGRWPVAGHSNATTAVSSVLSTPRTYSLTTGARLSALPTATASTVSSTAQTSVVAATPRRSTFAEAAPAEGRSGASAGVSTSAHEQQQQWHDLTYLSASPSTAPGIPAQAGQTPRLAPAPPQSKCPTAPPPTALLAGTSSARLPPSQAAADGADSFAPSAAQERRPHRPRQSPLLSAPRFAHGPPSPPMRAVGAAEVYFLGSSTASSVQSHEATTKAPHASFSGVAAAPARQPPARAGSSGDSGVGNSGDSFGAAARNGGQVDTRTDTSAEAHRRPPSTPASAFVSSAPVELPQWVRERSLSALYYQPWGLELLARYEAARHEQQLARARMARPAAPGVSGSTNALAAVISELGVGGDTSTPPSPAVSMPNSSLISPSNVSTTTLSTFATSSPAAPTAAQHASVFSRTPSGTSGEACASTATGAEGAPPVSSSSTPRVSWAAALRQPRHANLVRGSSGGHGPTTALVLEWPPELSAAEEMDAWEEAHYFGEAATPPSLPQQQQQHPLSVSRCVTKLLDRVTRDANAGVAEETDGTVTVDLAGRVTGPSGQARASSGSGHRVTSSTAASAAVSSREQWCLDKEIQAPTLYLSRQRRPSRRRSRAAYASDTFRSSTARRAGATSAAAELFHRRKDVHFTATVGEAAVAPTCVEEMGEAAPVSHPAPRGDVALHNDGYARKEAAQFCYPVPSPHETIASPPPSFKSSHHTTSQGTGAGGGVATLPRVSAPLGADAIERAAGVADSEQQQQHVDGGNSIARDGQVLVGASAAKLEGSALKQVIDSYGGDGGEESDAAGPGVGGHLSGRSSADSLHGAGSDPMRGAAGSAFSTRAAISASSPRAALKESRTVRRGGADVDAIFFLQKFIRAVMIVLIAQVRLQQLRQRQECELPVYPLHDATCPARAYMLNQQAQVQLRRAKYWSGGDPDRVGPASAAEVSDGSGLSKLERRALSFVRHYMADYRHMITAYVMRDDREVARRSAQAILSPPRSMGAAPSLLPASAVVSVPGATGKALNSAPDPLFRQDFLARWLSATRVNTAYEEAVRVATNGLPCGADANVLPATPLDDVEPLRTAQVYISGKDAAWQPLLMELLQVNRVVQCYSDGPVVAEPTEPGAAPSAPATPAQRILLASLEKFLAQPTLPLLRHSGSGAAATAQALATTPDAHDLSTTSSLLPPPLLTPAQEAAAAAMAEESEAFRAYLLSGYLTDTDAGTRAGTPSAAVSATTTLRQSQSAPTLSSGVALPSKRSPEPSSPLFNSASLLQPLTWYPYAHMPGTACPYAESTDLNSTRVTPAQAASASSMTLYVAMLPLSGRLLWRWVVPAEDTDNFNLSVFFQSSLFSFMQGGPLPMPSVGYVPTPSMTMMMAPPPSPHPSLAWPPALAARIDAQLRSDAIRSAWDGAPPPCVCGAAAVMRTGHQLCAGVWSETPEVTLVHCSAGMHRSCGILIAFLLWLLYQCRQVLYAERTLGCGPLSSTHAPASAGDADAVNALLRDDVDTLAPVTASPAAGEDGQQQPAQRARSSVTGTDAPWLTSRLLQRTIRHVQQQRSIAVPIRTVQFLLQSFANELRLD
ncbi:hypothetical protein LSCM1_08091 [Leishmania martiniquensis]|uniref:Uncharacterized protein n=1 Tax=Leishmania martiniquensis TaxID=1580590 RepID=A0A836H6I8_9TRYP|nr:hypothetical protein LSCM1_08091 [Leishmania martiniquensis]